MDRNDEQRKQGLETTLGGRMFTFGLRKIGSIMKSTSRLFHENNPAQRVSMLRNSRVRFSREPHRTRGVLAPLMQWRLPNEPRMIEKTMNKRRTQIDRKTGNQATRQPVPLSFNVPSYGGGGRDVSKRGPWNGQDRMPFLMQPPDMPKDDNVRERRTTLSRPLLNVFSRLLRMRLPSVTVRQHKASDAFLARHRADAMTLGTDIYFRTGTFDLRASRSLGLLGHELTHVAQHRGKENIRRGSRESNEKTALANERFVLANVSAPGMKSAIANSVYRAAAPQGTSQAAQPAKISTPLFAESSREVNDFSPPPVERVAAPLSQNDLMRIKDEVYRDLMLRIKVDFERGA